jgi:hypothetical protein
MPAGIFDRGPQTGPPGKIRRIRFNDPRIRRRALLVIAITWLPLALISAVEHVFGNAAFGSFLKDFGVHARFLVAAPLLVIGESWCQTRLSRSAAYLGSSGIVAPKDQKTFETHIASTSRWVNSLWADVVGLILAYAAVLAVIDAFPISSLPKWHVHWQSGIPVYSAAGYWHALVSLPVLFLELLGWIWRHLLWWRFLRLTSKLPLRLIAAHPDRSGGLKFLGTVLRGYWSLCAAWGVIIAGGLANQIRTGASIYDFRYIIIGLVTILLIFILIPFTAFIPVLVKLREHGMFNYGALADALGDKFETKWLKCSEPVSPSVLEKPDFSATIDLYSVVGNVQQIQLFPANFSAIRDLVVVTLLPFVPVALASVPLDTILTGLGKILV